MTGTISTQLAKSNGTEVTRFNALKHGILSRNTVLPWEDEDEYRSLLESLVAEHTPQGPTEEHLVEELAGIVWRKRRLRLAEASAYRRGLSDCLDCFSMDRAAVAHLDFKPENEGIAEAVQATPEMTIADIHEIQEHWSATEQAIGILKRGRKSAYQSALNTLLTDTGEWWAETIDETNEQFTNDAQGLLQFLETKIMPWYAQRLAEFEHRPLLKIHAIGESFDPNRLERLARYEVHLDRKMERMLAMLIKLQDLRCGTTPE